MLKVMNKYTRMASGIPQYSTYFTQFSFVSNVGFEQINICWISPYIWVIHGNIMTRGNPLLSIILRGLSKKKMLDSFIFQRDGKITEERSKRIVPKQCTI